MPDHLPRRQVLRTAGALGLGAAAAGALSSTAEAATQAGSAADMPDKLAAMGEHHGKLDIRKDPFGTAPDGQQVDVYTFTNGRVTVSMLTWGATIQRIVTPDRRGRSANISLGFDNLPDYAALSPYFGATIGRYGNRIAKGRFTIDGTTYQIPVNDGENALHGGTLDFDKKGWKAKTVETSSAVGVAFTYVSPARRPLHRTRGRPHHHRPHRPAGYPVLQRQLPRRHVPGDRQQGLPPGRRLRLRDPALPGLAQPRQLPVDGAAAGRDLQVDHRLQLRHQVARTEERVVVAPATSR